MTIDIVHMIVTEDTVEGLFLVDSFDLLFCMGFSMLHLWRKFPSQR
jgi:hypothetical protein